MKFTNPINVRKIALQLKIIIWVHHEWFDLKIKIKILTQFSLNLKIK